MKTTLGKKARLLALAALIAVLPLGIWACEDSGDGPDGPTGPATQYNPQIDYPDWTITAKVSTSPVAPGAIFGGPGRRPCARARSGWRSGTW